MADSNLLRFQQVFRDQAQALERREREERQAEVEQCRERLLRAGLDPGVYGELAGRLAKLGDYGSGLAVLREGVASCPPTMDLWIEYIGALRRANRTQAAIAAARQAASWFPVPAGLAEALLLPRLSTSSQELET